MRSTGVRALRPTALWSTPAGELWCALHRAGRFNAAAIVVPMSVAFCSRDVVVQVGIPLRRRRLRVSELLADLRQAQAVLRHGHGRERMPAGVVEPHILELRRRAQVGPDVRQRRGVEMLALILPRPVPGNTYGERREPRPALQQLHGRRRQVDGLRAGLRVGQMERGAATDRRAPTRSVAISCGRAPVSRSSSIAVRGAG